MWRKIREKMSKNWLTKEEALNSGKLSSADESYRNAVNSGRRFLSKTRCADIGLAVKKNEEPGAYVYSDEGVRPNFYMPIFERTDFFQTHQKLDKNEINREDNLHLVPRSQMKDWGFKRYKGLPVEGYIEDENELEVVYNILETAEYQENKLKMLLEVNS
ncbi:TPA: hypothetical protein ACLBZV_005544 [Bacillus cereus]|uniref:hypothetical protein n=1 Tax=Bacillus cereus TaxID=1396 RepID=UPI001246FA5E|nr:hypothetical protein [Bacillus cereus]BCC15185.1 hypothetical protein BCM0074_p305 [Bacillus cereus]HDR6306406.1 hypothetical protein [Bacillus cereus]